MDPLDRALELADELLRELNEELAIRRPAPAA